MTGLGLVSAKGSAGVTTSAILMAALWPRPAVLVEADPAGGDLRYWYSDEHARPLRADRGVVSLLTARGQQEGLAAGAGLAAHMQTLPGGLPVLVGPDGPAQVEATQGLWDRLASSTAEHDGHVVVDAGRLTNRATLAHTMPLLRACDLTLLVCRATVPSLAHAKELFNLLQTLELPTHLLLIGADRDREDAASVIACHPEHVHLLPTDPTAAESLAGAWSRRLDRSHLVSAARNVASDLYTHLHLSADRASRTNHRGADPVPAAEPAPLTGQGARS